MPLRMMAHASLFIGILALCSCASWTSQCGDKGKMQIILKPLATSPTVSFAADELAEYLCRMTGDTWRIVDHKPALRRVSIQMSIDESLGIDAWRVEGDGNTILIQGGNARGMMYGAYALLKELGAEWPIPGDKFETVPFVGPLKWTGELAASPAVPGRGMVADMWVQNDYFLDLVDFLGKQGFNYIHIHMSGALEPDFEKRLAAEMAKRDIGLEYGGHLLPSMLPRALFDEHPEYFRMENGERTPHLNYCPSSEEAADIIAAGVANRLDEMRQKYHRIDSMDIWPDDLMGGGWCSCPKCKDLSESAQSLLAMNQLAKRLDLGETGLMQLAYHTSIIPPENIKGGKNVQLLYAPRERSYLEPLDTGKSNSLYYERLKQLIEIVPEHPRVFEYYHDMVLFRQLPMPLPDVIGRDVTLYLQAGVDHIGSLSFPRYDCYAYGMNTFVLARALWRGEGSEKDLRDYCDALYGPAAGKYMNDYFIALGQLCATAMDTNDYDGFTDLRIMPPNQPGTVLHRDRLAPLVSDENLSRIENLIHQAIEASESPWRERIERQWPLWQFARLETVSIFKGIDAVTKMDAVMKTPLDSPERLELISQLEDSIARVQRGTAILLSIPEKWKGGRLTATDPALHERDNVDLISQKAAIEQLKTKVNP